MMHTIGEYIDRLMTVEMRPARGLLPRGHIHHFYDAVRERQGGPLSSKLAQRADDALHEGSWVLILTGAGSEPMLPVGEVDGLPGAAALARALQRGYGARPVIITEARMQESVRRSLAGVGMVMAMTEAEMRPGSALFVASSEDDVQWRRQAVDLFDLHRPDLVIAIEKLSPNVDGVTMNATGIDCSQAHTNPEPLFTMARARGVLTAAIGDGGNEVGFGVISDVVNETLPGKIASSIEVDQMVVAAISDWGAYALCASLAYVRRDTSMLVSADEVEDMIRLVVAAGSFDGTTCRPTLSDDGAPLDVQRAFATMLTGVVSIAMSTWYSPGHDVAIMKPDYITGAA